jgi:hypothetical protein
VKQKIKLNTCRLSTKELLPTKRISEQTSRFSSLAQTATNFNPR